MEKLKWYERTVNSPWCDIKTLAVDVEDWVYWDCSPEHLPSYLDEITNEDVDKLLKYLEDKLRYLQSLHPGKQIKKKIEFVQHDIHCAKLFSNYFKTLKG